MSLKPSLCQEVPKETKRITKSAFPKGNKYIHIRDSIGSIFKDKDFHDLFSQCGQPAISPWRLALVTILQFIEGLSDRQAADATRARLDWKYLLALELTDSGFDYSILSEFRKRLLASDAENRLLSILLDKFKQIGILQARGQQRTDSTHVLSSVRMLNRLELIGETMRAALNEIATIEPKWIQEVAPEHWYEKYKHRVENYRLPKGAQKKKEYAESVGSDGLLLFDLINSYEGHTYILELPKVKALKKTLDRHFVCNLETKEIFLKTNKEVSQSEDKIESPYDTEARFRTKRDKNWSGYMVHLTETCDENSNINVITHVHTTAADVHDIKSIKTIQHDLAAMNIPPKEHIVDTAYISLEQLVKSKKDYDIDLIGPPKETSNLRSKISGGYVLDSFSIDWKNEVVICPQGKKTSSWNTTSKSRPNSIIAVFSVKDCRICKARDLCIGSKKSNRNSLSFPVQEYYEARNKLLKRLKTDDGKKLYDKRSGIEGTISQGVRTTNLRKSRYSGIRKTHLQEIAGAAAMNICRLGAWLENLPLAKTRKSSFYRLKRVAA